MYYSHNIFLMVTETPFAAKLTHSFSETKKKGGKEKEKHKYNILLLRKVYPQQRQCF